MDQYQRELGDINRHSDGLAADLEETIKKLDAPTQRDEVKRELKTLVGKLRGIAGSHKPDPNAVDPTDPNVTGKPRDGEKKTENQLNDPSPFNNQNLNPNPNPNPNPFDR